MFLDLAFSDLERAQTTFTDLFPAKKLRNDGKTALLQINDVIIRLIQEQSKGPFSGVMNSQSAFIYICVPDLSACMSKASAHDIAVLRQNERYAALYDKNGGFIFIVHENLDSDTLPDVQSIAEIQKAADRACQDMAKA